MFKLPLRGRNRQIRRECAQVDLVDIVDDTEADIADDVDRVDGAPFWDFVLRGLF